MKNEDIEFLRDLQHELNTQTNDGNANPVYWGVMERKLVRVPEDCGGDEYICTGESYYTLDEYVDYLNNIIDESDEEYESWKELDKSDIDEVIDFSNDEMCFGCYKIYLEEQDVLCQNTGAFLTKREAQRYVKTYAYNHSKPRTWAMTAYRNFELEHLLNILKTINIDDIKVDEI